MDEWMDEYMPECQSPPTYLILSFNSLMLLFVISLKHK